MDVYPLEQDFPKSVAEWPPFCPLFAVRIKLGKMARRKALSRTSTTRGRQCKACVAPLRNAACCGGSILRVVD